MDQETVTLFHRVLNTRCTYNQLNDLPGVIGASKTETCHCRFCKNAHRLLMSVILYALRVFISP